MAQGKPDQDHRLKAALRENLKRRKAQARQRREAEAGPPGTPATDKRDSSGD